MQSKEEECGQLDSDEFLEIARELEQHHSIFGKLWHLGRPQFSSKYKTAAVEFDRVGECINFLINPDFWKMLDIKQKSFVLAHECLHVILCHGIRTSLVQDQESWNEAGQALDIIVNHALVEKFSFIRDDVDPKKKYCWLDTLFPEQTIASDKNFEYYYNLIKLCQIEFKSLGQQSLESNGKNNDKLSGNLSNKNGNGDQESSSTKEKKESGNPNSIIDNHEGLHTFNCDELVEQIKNSLSPEEIETLKDFVQKHIDDLSDDMLWQAGTSPGNIWVKVNADKVKHKKKWETIIKNWAKKWDKEKDEEQFGQLNRRFVLASKEFLLPTDNKEIDSFDKQKIDVFFFLDTSGSCSHLATRFFKAAKSLPPERFNLYLFCFDTSTYEVDINVRKLYGFGGTSFSCIETRIQKEIKKRNIPYPKAVFVISDGYGNYVHPEYPERWHWFLSVDYRYYIPKASKIYMLKDFE